MNLLLLSVWLPVTLASNPLQEFTSGNNLFTASVYKEISKNERGNFLVSPFSAESVLALTLSGAKDSTAEELRAGLRLPTLDTTHKALKDLQPTLQKKETYNIQTANKIYLKQSFEVNEEFRKTAVDVFGSEVEKIDFDQADQAVKTMNDWVEEKTESRIKNLISSSNINSRTRAILLNALYFKGNWSHPFKLHMTFKQDFYKNGQELVQVDTMHSTEKRNYYEDEDLKAKFLEIPFKGGEASLTIVLPNEKNGISNLETQIEKLVSTPKFAQENVRVAIPKFKIESSINFKNLLQQLGVSRIFKDEEADLSGIAGKKGDLVVDQVLQKAFVDVSEEGVEAAAATFVAVGIPLSGVVYVEPPKEFIVDHPFIFYIKVKDLILFAGRVMDPRQ